VIFYGVGHWNSYFDALLYLRTSDRYPLQIVLREILVLNQALAGMMDGDAVAEIQRIVETVKYGIIIVASLPMLMLYPFMQKYFVKGVMLGSIKG
jgi:putative aldouronate transport system permease protein